MPRKMSSMFAVLAAAAAVAAPPTLSGAEATAGPGPDLWLLANQSAQSHRFSTLFTSHDVRDYLSDPIKLQAAIAWCKQTGVTKVYIESFRDGYQAQRNVLLAAKEAFGAAGFQVSGCVTTTRVGKPSTGWKEVACCFTDKTTQERLRTIFEYATGIFDETMIDDFWFTDCACPECDAARKAKKVTIGDQVFAVKGDSWEDYRCELMTRLSEQQLLGPAKRNNPKARLIIKYPQWYDSFHERGYEVIRETAEFDRIWVGTETRDYEDNQWGGTAQYEGYFIMRWLGGIGGPKCGGGWYDPYGTTQATYLEQARQTILGGARESMLFEYSSLLRDTGPSNIATLRDNLPELFSVAKQVLDRSPVGVAAYKPANSHPGKEAKVFDFVGMLGVPLVPCHEFPETAPAAFFSIHALQDPALPAKLGRYIKSGKPVLVTDGLAAAVTNQVPLNARNVQVLKVGGVPKTLLLLKQPTIDALRAGLLANLKTSFSAPARVAFYLFNDGSWVVENFNDSSTTVSVNGTQVGVPSRGWKQHWVQ